MGGTRKFYHVLYAVRRHFATGDFPCTSLPVRPAGYAVDGDPVRGRDRGEYVNVIVHRMAGHTTSCGSDCHSRVKRRFGLMSGHSEGIVRRKSTRRTIVMHSNPRSPKSWWASVTIGSA